jgi:hypothetical protein
MANHNKNIDFFHYTPINNKIDFIRFKEHSDFIISEQITDTVADLMINVEEMIVSSKAFKTQTNKPIVNHMKWQVYKVKKVPLTSLCMILNKITDSNLDNVIKETLEYKLYTLSDLNQLSDVFLGKCIMETKNVDNYINYLKQVMLNKLWYVYDSDNNVISFRDAIIDRLENEYVRLTKIAGQIEDVFKNQYKDDSLINKLDGSEEYLKKKNIIVSVIKLIGSFYNGKIISTSLVEHILNKLRYNYDENINMKKIYLELWLVLWDSVSLNLKNYYMEVHKNNNEWLLNVYNKLNEVVNEDKEWDIVRLVTLIERSLGLSEETISNKNNTSSKNELTIYDINIEDFKELLETINIDDINKTEITLNKFKYNYDSTTLNKYIIRYMLDNCVSKTNSLSTTFNNSLKIIRKHLLDESNFLELINNTLDDDEIICDFPIFRKHIKEYM